MAYVISASGRPLMPCSNAIARILLKQKKAKVKSREPFVIRLLYDTTEYTQELTLGVDTGSGTIGTAVSDRKGNIVYMSEAKVRNDITHAMTQRRKYRRSRRNRKTRYRNPRFNNRKNSRRSERLSPTVTSKIHSHVKEIEYIRSILPVAKIVLETGQFDPHLMKNPALADPKVRHWGYQKGPNYGYENTRAMVLDRDEHECQCCHGKHKDSRLEVHHIIFRSNGGSDDPKNLITLCRTCHTALHRGEISLKRSGMKKTGLRHATQMNVIRTQLMKKYPEAVETFGYVTKANRFALGADKTHYNDACVIATQGRPFTVRTRLYKKACVPDGDFQKTKGVRSERSITTGKIGGFRKFDKVLYYGREYFIKGRMSSGYAVLMDIDGNKADFSALPRGSKTPRLSRMKRITARSSWMVTGVAVTQNTV